MIKEAYISYKTAKLLKEKGFNIPYDSFRGVYINGEFKRLNPGAGFGYNFGDEIVEVCSLQMAMRWLREVHNLNIEPYATAPGFRFQINKAGNIKVGDISGGTSVYDSNFDGPNDGGAWDTYEDACEAAIKYCLTNLI